MSKKVEKSHEDLDLYKVRHSCAHVLAQVVLELFPDAKLGIGPATSDGFYYDFEISKSLTPEDLETIEERMKVEIKKNHAFITHPVSRSEAIDLFKNQPYKLELISDICEADNNDSNGLTIYKHGNFVDLCKGPHIEATGEINPEALKLLSLGGVYWKSDASKPMLQRISGTVWRTKEELEQYLYRIEEAKKRDHRLLGKSLELFSFSEDVGAGLVLWNPKGAMLRFLSEKFSQEAHILNGYDWVYSPHIGRSNLWRTSGHLDFFKESMYSAIEIDEEEYYLKPMNCPFHILVYKNRPRSYRELPLRLAEYGTVYRYELSGALHGLSRVRGFTQDDAHIFCRPDQAEEEVMLALQFSMYVIRAFGMTEFKAYVSTKPEGKAIGSDEDWDSAIEKLVKAVEAEGLSWEYDLGGGAFYGPKIDIKVKDAIGREWQLSTVQFDFNLPGRFGIEYIGSDGMPHKPIMVHRALFGSVERFIGTLIEFYGGAFPLWLSPKQIIIIPIADKHLDYAKGIEKNLKRRGLRVSVNDAKDRMQAKVRDAEMEKIPYVFVVGNKEADEETISVRSYKDGDIGSMKLADFLNMVEPELAQGRPVALDNFL